MCRLCLELSGGCVVAPLLQHVDVASRAGRAGAGDGVAALGADERQVAFGHVRAILRGLHFPLEFTDFGDVLQGERLLPTERNTPR